MKKYLMTGIAALAIGGTFTSCGPDMSSYSGNPTEQVVQNYENKFVQAFGEPAPNQTWGFGSSTVAGARGMTRSVGTYADYKGSLTPEESYQDQNDNWQWKTRPYTFPSGPESYPSGKPENASYYGGGYQYLNGGNIWMDENVSNHVEVQGYCNLYIVKSGSGEGNVDIAPDNYWYVGNVTNQQKIRVYICPGVNLTILPTFANNLQANVEYYVCPGAQLTCNANFKLNGTALYVAPGGTATFTSLETNSDGLIYNQGSITTSGKIYIANEKSVLVNDGNITAGSATSTTEMEIAGSGRVQNNAEMNIYGNTFISSNRAMWANNGHWTTTYYTYIAGSFNVINNCYLEVTEDFRMNLGDGQGSFRMDSGAGVLTKNLCAGGPFDSYTGGPFRSDMGSNSVFKVTGTAHLNATKQNGYGFHGNGDGYAVFQAKDVVKETTGEANVTYAGKLYVSAETHFAQGNSGQYPYIKFEDGCSEANIYAAGDDKFSTGNPDITIPATPCNPGFGGGGGVQPVTETIRVIGEDLTVNDANSDFDFNDIVFDVIWNKTTGKVSVKFLAAGGELPIYIGPDDNSAWELHGLFADKEKEVAEKGGKTARNITTKTMMNTAKDKQNGNVIRDAYECPEKELPDSWWSGGNIQDIANSIEIRVQKSGTLFVLKAPEGKAPSKIAVDTDYNWCGERDNINTIYGKFNDYVEHNSYAWNEWYK